MTPITVQIGTVMRVICTVSQNADWNAGRPIAWMTGSRPFSNARMKTIATGSKSSRPRYRSAMPRTVRRTARALVASPWTGLAPVAAALEVAVMRLPSAG